MRALRDPLTRKKENDKEDANHSSSILQYLGIG
jgi:hypothetical protein